MPVSWPSTQGCASSRRRPAANASRCANRRTAASSANRIVLRRKPFPSSTHTASGAVTRTSVVPSAHSSGSRMPAPVSSVCSTRRLVRTSVSPSIPPDSARIAAATTLGRKKTQRGGLGRQPLAHAFDQRAAHAARRFRSGSARGAAPQAPGGPPPRARIVRPSRRPPCSSCSASCGCSFHRRQQRQAGDVRDFGCPQSARRRAPNHQPEVGIDRGQHRGHRSGRRARPHIARADDDDEVGGIQRGLGGVGQTTGQIAHDGDSPAAAGIDDGVDRPGVQLVAAPRAGQHADAVESRQRVAHGRPVRARPPCNARSGQRRPGVVSPPSSRSTPPPQGSRSTSSASVAACARATANSDAPAPPQPPMTATTSPRNPSSRHRFGGFGKFADQFMFLRGQAQHVLGADRNGGRPGGRRGFGGGQHADVSAARQTPRARTGRPPPRRAPLPRRPSRFSGSPPITAGVHHSNTDRRGHPVQLVAQVRGRSASPKRPRNPSLRCRW